VDGRNAEATSNDRYLISLIGQDLMRIRLAMLSVSVKIEINWLPAYNSIADPLLPKPTLVNGFDTLNLNWIRTIL